MKSFAPLGSVARCRRARAVVFEIRQILTDERRNFQRHMAHALSIAASTRGVEKTELLE